MRFGRLDVVHLCRSDLNPPGIADGRKESDEDLILLSDSVQSLQFVTEDVSGRDPLVDKSFWPVDDILVWSGLAVLIQGKTYTQ